MGRITHHRVDVVGLGKLGLPIALVHAAAGHSVVGIDNNPDTVAALRAGDLHDEPGIRELWERSRQRISFQHSPTGDADFTLVIVPTPSLDSGAFDLDLVLDAMGRIGATAKRGQIVVLVSTVVPGACEGTVIPALEQASGMVVGQDLGLAYSPELLALGTAIRDLVTPKMVILGASDPSTRERARSPCRRPRRRRSR